MTGLIKFLFLVLAYGSFEVVRSTIAKINAGSNIQSDIFPIVLFTLFLALFVRYLIHIYSLSSNNVKEDELKVETSAQ